jgi:hypothetical protein
MQASRVNRYAGDLVTVHKTQVLATCTDRYVEWRLNGDVNDPDQGNAVLWFSTRRIRRPA